MKISITLPGWVQRRWIASYLEKYPYILSGMSAKRASDVGILSVENSTDISPGVREFIIRGMEETGLDALTFVRTVKRFPSVKTTFKFGMDID